MLTTAVLVYFQMNHVLLLYLELAMVDVGNVSKKGENMEGITRSIFTSWFFNGTLSIRESNLGPILQS